MLEAYVVWCVLTTNVCGMGDGPVPIKVAETLSNELNAFYGGEVYHWLYVPANAAE